MKGFIIKSNFFGIFKIGDNINYNLSILRCLYNFFEQSDYVTQKLLIKPIVVLLVAIIEAVLHDFILRITRHTSEGVRMVTSDVLNDISGKQLDKLDKYIASVRKHNFFDKTHAVFYEKLEILSRTRNRVHIQNAKWYKPHNEEEVFTHAIKDLAEKCLEIVLKTMNQKFPRSENKAYVNDMHLPWNEHYPEAIFE